MISISNRVQIYTTYQVSSIALACFSTPAATECAGYATGLDLVDEEPERDKEEEGFHDGLDHLV